MTDRQLPAGFHARPDLLLITTAVSCSRPDCSVEFPCPSCSDILRIPLEHELRRLCAAADAGDPDAAQLETRIAEIRHQLSTLSD